MSIYNRISEIFDIKDLLQTKNPIRTRLGITKVELDKGKGSNSIQIHITEQDRGKQRILLFDHDREGKSYGHFRYNNRTFQNDSGDIIQFIANRLEGRRLNDAIKLLNSYNYKINAKDWKTSTDFEVSNKRNESSNTKPLDIEMFADLRGIDKLILTDQPHYLEKRHILNDILLHPKFIDTVMVYDNPIQTKTGPITFTNVLFPKFDPQGNKILGAEIKTGAKTNNNLCLGLDHLMWNSNKPEHVNKVAVFESAIDALSHYQMNQNDNLNTWYFSTNGNFYTARQSWFFDTLEINGLNFENHTLVLGTDRDYDGFMYDMAIYNKVLASALPDKGQNPQEFFLMGNVAGKPAIEFHSHDLEMNKDVQQWFFHIQDHFNNDYVNKNDNHHIGIKASNDRISLIFPSKAKLKDASKRLSSSLLRNIPLLHKSHIKVHKASHLGKPLKDWNTALALKASNAKRSKGNSIKNKKSFI